MMFMKRRFQVQEYIHRAFAAREKIRGNASLSEQSIVGNISRPDLRTRHEWRELTRRVKQVLQRKLLKGYIYACHKR